MFDQLPETYPAPSKKKKAFVGSAAVHVVMVSAIILVQMVAPQKLGEMELLTTLYMAPVPPPPLSPTPETAREVERRAPRAKEIAPAASAIPIREAPPVTEEPALTAPTTIPKDVAKIIDAGPGSVPGNVIGAVPGGLPGGTPGGLLGGVLGGAGSMPPPPPPQEPIRVGGKIREPKIVKLVPPIYPQAAVDTRVQGVVVLEATVTEQGNVEKVKVISGHPLLVDAATDAVQKWKYEPTILNGSPVPVILTARVNFSLTRIPR